MASIETDAGGSGGSDATLYPHPPIDKTSEIRLLRVRDIKDDDRISCEFLVVSIDKPSVPYQAISYCWGDPEMVEKAWFSDSQYLRITRSAACILRYFATKESKEYIWIDGLCINQSDISEKNGQVPLMAVIYSKSEEVTGWLGQWCPRMEAGLQFVTLLWENIQQLVEAGKPINMQNVLDCPGCDYPSSGWHALVHVLDQEFFKRIWIIQEMVVPLNVVLVCGKVTIPWDTLKAISMIHGYGMGHLLVSMDDGHAAKGLLGVVVINGFRNQPRDQYQQTLQDRLLNCYSFLTTDPRDKIFALRNISMDGDHEELYPDYEAPTEDVFMRAALHFLLRGKDLTILSAAGIGLPRQTPNLPSWAPDWSVVRDGTIFGPLAERAGYKACGKHAVNARISCDKTKRLVTIRGRIIDNVRSIVQSAPDEEWTLDPEKIANKYAANFAWLKYLSELCTEYPTKEPYFPDVLARTLVANITPVGNEAPPSFTAQFMDFWNLNKLLAASPLDDENAPSQETVGSALQYFEALGNAITLHTLFTTENSYFGLGPQGLGEKDVLCLFNGATVPFLLRPRDEGGYLLVGECYVDGLMKGEGQLIGVEEDLTIF